MTDQIKTAVLASTKHYPHVGLLGIGTLIEENTKVQIIEHTGHHDVFFGDILTVVDVKPDGAECLAGPVVFRKYRYRTFIPCSGSSDIVKLTEWTLTHRLEADTTVDFALGFRVHHTNPLPKLDDKFTAVTETLPEIRT